MDGKNRRLHRRYRQIQLIRPTMDTYDSYKYTPAVRPPLPPGATKLLSPPPPSPPPPAAPPPSMGLPVAVMVAFMFVVLFIGVSILVFRFWYEERWGSRSRRARAGDDQTKDADANAKEAREAKALEALQALPLHKHECITESNEQGECQICAVELATGDEMRTLPCGHCYHKHCVSFERSSNPLANALTDSKVTRKRFDRFQSLFNDPLLCVCCASRLTLG